MTASALPSPAAHVREALEREHRAIDGGIEHFAAHPSAPEGRSRLGDALTALRRHIWLEEEYLFPPLRATGLMAPVFVMLSEHRQLWATMEALEQQVEEGGSPEVLRDTATTLLAQLDRHNSKEEPILYSQADVALSEDARAELEDLIAHEELPAGWSCST